MLALIVCLMFIVLGLLKVKTATSPSNFDVYLAAALKAIK